MYWCMQEVVLETWCRGIVGQTLRSAFVHGTGGRLGFSINVNPIEPAGGVLTL
ncbi:hypothetical protein P154DRAFT_516663 [Amniculicola lignicola CBS 123094]|uniref:Uncharacterized protein n=1 Tax=Amniculicola lignicola CBS 123094 TaxID=1392246 RepID=A0A6A5X4L0_9PLEO|nr:hypothetical protein P154DRAFT_516663 [Amniculicola lignicola CBS 123094]